MKVSKYLLAMMMGSCLMTGAAFAQAADSMTTPDSSTSTSTSTTPGAGSSTKVEIQNQVPAQAPQTSQSTPNIDIKMPDVNVQQPAGSTTTKETVTEHNTSTYVHDSDTNDADVAQTNNTWMMVLFAVLAVLLIGAVVVGMNRRVTVIDDV